MIGSLLFYALYPLSRFLTSRRHAETSKKGLPPAAVNGTTLLDGDAVTTKRFTHSPTSPSPGSATEGDTEERMNERSSENQDDAAMERDKAETAIDPCEEIKVSEMQPSNMEAPTNERAPNSEEKTEVGTEDVGSEQNLEATSKSLQTNDVTEESTCSETEQNQKHEEETSVIPPTDDTQDSTFAAQTDAGTEVSASADTTTECWDEYYVSTTTADGMHYGTSVTNVAFSSLPSNLQFSQQYNQPAQWHFPAGPGFTEEVQCPLWQFPAGSYYPQVETAMPFEVMWRVWQDVDEGSPAEEPVLVPFPSTKTTLDFSVMSYNILAQDLLEANEELYVHCPLEVLDWNYRCGLLLQEIETWAPDILCLQEVQENHYHKQLHPVLCAMGYTCVYKRRTGSKTDGCATCYRSSRFSEASASEVEFFRPELEVLNRHNVGIVLLLRPLVDQGSESETRGPFLCVANTHLLFNPRRGDVKLAQLAVILAEIDKTVKSCKVKGEHCNVVLCGDFNSVPHMPLYQLITTGGLYYQGLPTWMISGQEDLSYKSHSNRLFAPLWPNGLGITDNCQYTSVNNVFDDRCRKSGKSHYGHDFMQQLRYCPAACVRPVDLQLIPGITDITPDVSEESPQHGTSFRRTLSHRFHLESVYQHILPGSGSAEVTTLHSEGGTTVDYIFYSPKCSDLGADGSHALPGLKLLSSLSLLSEDALWSMKGLPNYMFPSDHLSLMAKFQLDLDDA